MNAPAPRRLVSWIDGWMQYTADLTSPALFRRWSAIAALSAAMERKVWITSQGKELFPNLYLILCGPPGVGKSTVLSLVERILVEIPDMHVAPSSVTAAALIDTMMEAKRSIVRPAQVPPVLEFNALAAVASELGVFLPAYDGAFMNTLTKMWDGEHYREARRGKDLRIEIKKPLLGLVAGTTPSYLNDVMPPGAWDQGFLSRTILVFSGETIISDPFATPARGEEVRGLYRDLLHDLKGVHGLVGEMRIEEEAKAAITGWVRAGLQPVPQHMKLTHYNTRRIVNLIKLCMISSMSRSSDMCITVEDYQTAFDWLMEAEEIMPDIFKAVGLGGDSRAIEECWYFVYETYAKEQRPVAEHRVIHFLKERVPAHSIYRVVEIMVRSKMLLSEAPGFYKPAPKQTHY